MKISKIRNVKTPTRGTEGSAGIDFYIPEDFMSNGKSLDHHLFPGESILIPSGIKVKPPKGYALIAFNKSGIATKHNSIVGACVVDEDYQGEVHIHIINVGKNLVLLEPGMKIIQFILVPVLYNDIEVVDITELYESESERGDGGFGSTGK